LEAEVTADCVVIGAGFTGLATAWQLALRKPEWRIAVVEAQRAGFGASGRNSGFAGAISHRDPDLDLEGTRRVIRLSTAGIEWLGSRVEEHGIDCDWTRCGRIHAAVEKHALRNLEGLLRLLNASGQPHEEMSRSDLVAAIGTDHYRAAVRIEDTVLLQPAALARGLVSTLPPNVDLFEESPVTEMERRGVWHVRAGRGAVHADRAFLTVNGFAPAFGLLKRRVFSLFTFASLTRALTAEEQAKVGAWDQWGLVSEDRIGTTLRRTRDQRLLVRSCLRYVPSLRVSRRVRSRVQKEHRRSLLARWPALEGIELEFTWGGVMGMTLNQGQFFGALDDDLYASVGYNGSGIALGTASGLLLADHALGADSDLLRDARSLPGPSWIPPEPLLGLGVHATLAFLGSRAGAER
jgi:glycine/D-amino acid oxidase-like deaminating enzyme